MQQLPASKYVKFGDQWRRQQAAARKAVPATAPVRAKPLPILPKAPADLRSQLPLPRLAPSSSSSSLRWQSHCEITSIGLRFVRGAGE